MRSAAIAFMAASASVVGILGTLHLVYTFFGQKLRPRDPSLEQRMRDISPVISRDTTMWKAWIGFNASHSMGAMLFGLVYGWLAMRQSELLFRSPYLLGLGLAFLLGYALLGRAYWFKIPYGGVLVSLGLYGAALLLFHL